MKPKQYYFGLKKQGEELIEVKSLRSMRMTKKEIKEFVLHFNENKINPFFPPDGIQIIKIEYKDNMCVLTVSKKDV